MKIIKYLFSLATIMSMAAALWSGDMELKSYKGSAEFESLKVLVGEWEGSSNKDDKEAFRVNYELTSNGSALVETLAPGTSHEMVSVYHDNNGKLQMTHYCAMGNQPVLSLKSSNKNSYELVFDKKKNSINSKTDMHMHALTISLPEENKLVHEWVSYQNGKAQKPDVFTFNRVESDSK